MIDQNCLEPPHLLLAWETVVQNADGAAELLQLLVKVILQNADCSAELQWSFSKSRAENLAAAR